MRLETRLLGVESANENYVIAIRLDGEDREWNALSTWPSKKAAYLGKAVGHKKKLKVQVSEGDHKLSVRLVAPSGVDCLVRVRQLLEEEDD